MLKYCTICKVAPWLLEKCRTTRKLPEPGHYITPFVISEILPNSFKMQIIIRGQESYVLEFSGNETLAELKARVIEHEGTEDVLLYASGKPLLEGLVSSIENCTVDVTLPLLGGKVSF